MNQEEALELKDVNEQLNFLYEAFQGKIPQASLIMFGVGIKPLPATVAKIIIDSADLILRWHSKKDSHLDNTNFAIIYDARSAVFVNMESVSDAISGRVQAMDDDDDSDEASSRNEWDEYFVQIAERDVLVTSCRKNKLDEFENKIRSTIQQIEIGLIHE